MPVSPSAPAFDVRRFSAGMGMIVSLVGVGVGVHLTRIKFVLSYTPCLSPYGGCSLGSMSCGAALDPPLSMLLGLPLSVWGSAFYLMTASLAAILVVRRDAFGGAVVSLLQALAAFAALVSAALAFYTVFALPSPCPFCVLLYAVSGLLLWTASIARRSNARSGEGSPCGAARCTRMLDAAYVGLMVFVGAAGVQSMAYHGMRGRVDAQVGCAAPESLPSAGIKVGVADPRVIIAVFLDMSCSVCRGEFKRLGKALIGAEFSAPVQLWIYHTPRQACDPDAFLDGYRKSADQARADNACLAARAVECMEKLQDGQGFALMGGLFALHDAREKDVPLFTAARIGERAVELGMDIDPDDAQNPLFQCIDTDAGVLARITSHQKYVEETEFRVPTVVIYRAIDGAPDLGHKPLFADARTPWDILDRYVAEQAGTEVTP